MPQSAHERRGVVRPCAVHLLRRLLRAVDRVAGVALDPLGAALHAYSAAPQRRTRCVQVHPDGRVTELPQAPSTNQSDAYGASHS